MTSQFTVFIFLVASFIVLLVVYHVIRDYCMAVICDSIPKYKDPSNIPRYSYTLYQFKTGKKSANKKAGDFCFVIIDNTTKKRHNLSIDEDGEEVFVMYFSENEVREVVNKMNKYGVSYE